jgi:hypothetical protein
MKLMNKKVLTLALVVVMMVSVFAISASAIDDGEYAASLQATVAFPPHTLDFFDGPAVVTTTGDCSCEEANECEEPYPCDETCVATVTIPLKIPASVTVFNVTVYGELDSAESATEGYTAVIEDGYLIVTGPGCIPLSEFAPTIIFGIERYDEVPHADMPAILHLAAIAN